MQLKDSPSKSWRDSAGHRQAIGRWTSIERFTPLAAESITAPKATIPVQWARSCGHFRSPQLSCAVWHHVASTCPPAGHGWPERLRSHFVPLGTRYTPYLGTPEPRARPDRVKWLHGSPAKSGGCARCRLLQAAAPCAKKLCDTPKSLSE